MNNLEEEKNISVGKKNYFYIKSLIKKKLIEKDNSNVPSNIINNSLSNISYEAIIFGILVFCFQILMWIFYGIWIDYETSVIYLFIYFI